MGNTVWGKMGLTLIIIFTIAVSTTTALQCYKCDCSVDGPEACNDDPASSGELVTCEPTESAGCFIVEVIKGELDAAVTRGCTGITNEELYKCSAHEVGQQFFTACNCHGDKCNSDWETAGDTVGNPLECYECSSIGSDDGDCSDTQPGGKMRCGPADTGCFISKSSLGDNKVVMERGCTASPCEDRFKCETVDDGHGGNTLQYCNCHGSGCNENWETAASTNTGSPSGVAQPTKVLLFFFAIVAILSKSPNVNFI